MPAEYSPSSPRSVLRRFKMKHETEAYKLRTTRVIGYHSYVSFSYLLETDGLILVEGDNLLKNIAFKSTHGERDAILNTGFPQQGAYQTLHRSGAQMEQ